MQLNLIKIQNKISWTGSNILAGKITKLRPPTYKMVNLLHLYLNIRVLKYAFFVENCIEKVQYLVPIDKWILVFFLTE